MTFSLQKTWKKFLKDLLGGIIKCALCTKAVCQTNSLKKKIRYSLSKIISDNDLARNIGKKGGPKRPESQLREKDYFLISARVHFQLTGIANFAMPSLSVETRIPVERVPKLLGKP